MAWQSSGEVQVPWACILQNGEIQSIHISDTPHSLRERRKCRYVCYGCGDRLIAHKRTQKADSFVHEAAPECPLTSADGSAAIHLNALLHLKHFLDKGVARAATLTVATPCQRCVASQAQRISRTVVSLLSLQPGDRVIMRERGVGTQQPDIRILRGTQVLLVLDIFAQQPCMDEIWASRDADKAPVVEVDARDIVGSQGGGRGEQWTSELPLLAHRTRLLESPECKAAHGTLPTPVREPSLGPPTTVPQPQHPVPTPPNPRVESRPPTPPIPSLGSLVEFRLLFFVKNQSMRAYYRLIWVTDGDGGHGELKEMDSNASVPSPRRRMSRYPDWLSGDLLKAAARSDVEKLKGRFRQEQGGHDFTLKEIHFKEPQPNRKSS